MATSAAASRADFSEGEFSKNKKSLRWVKADLHIHSGEDPADFVEHSALDLIERAHELGFSAVAITLHDHVLTQPEVFCRAAELGLLLIPAAERRIEGADVVLLNTTEDEAASLRTFRDLARLKERRGDSLLTFAPHPFYVLGGSIGERRLEQHIESFDAIEYCHFHTARWNLNESARRLAQRHAKPLLATSDAHRLDYFGDHYSLLGIDGPLTIDATFRAIRAGRIRHVSPPWSWPRLLGLLAFIFFTHPIQNLNERLSR